MGTAEADDFRRRAVESLARACPSVPPETLVPVGSGLDHHVFRAGDLVVRVGHDGDVAQEAALLGLLRSRLDCALPDPRFVDADLGVIAYPWLPGEPLIGRRAPAELADRLGSFLRHLHSADVAELPSTPVDDSRPADWLDGLTGPEEVMERLRDDVPPPFDGRVLVHNDLGAEHLLEGDGELTGVIDWSDAALSDPAVDFGRILRDFGAGFLDRVVTGYGGPSDAGFARRVLYYARCAALEDVAYGLESGRTRYREPARASLGRLFPPER